MSTDTLTSDIDEKRTELVRALALLLDDTIPDDEQRNNLRARLHHGYDPSSEHAERGTLIGQNFYGDYRPLQLVTLAGNAFGTAPAIKGTLLPEQNLTVASQPIDDIRAGGHTEFVTAATEGKILHTPFAVVRGPISSLHLPGIPLADGSWVLTADDLASLSLPAEIISALEILPVALDDNGLVIGPPQELLPQDPPDPPTISVLSASGSEDNTIPLSIFAGLNDPNAVGILSVVINGLPAAAQLSAGTRNQDGSWSVDPADLATLTLTPPPNWSGSLSLTISATNTENGRSTTTTASLPVHVSGVADVPVLSVGPASGMEGQTIPLAIAASSPDVDGSETLTVKITGLPAGSVLSAGTPQADGSWRVEAGDLPGLTLTPPAHWSGTINLGIVATSAEDGTTASTSATLPLNIGGIATSPILTVTAANGTEGNVVPLAITVGMVDNDGSETLTVIIDGLPAGASLSAGTRNADGSWSLAAADLAGLTLVPPPYWGGSFNLTIVAQTSENGTIATAQAQLPVNVDGVVETPQLSASAGTGTEGHVLPIIIVATIDDNDGSETLLINIDDLPPGAILSAGTRNADGSWTLAPGDLPGLVLVPGPNWSGTAHLTITAVAEEGGHSASIQGTLPISIAGVATTPSLSLGTAVGSEGNAIALPIQAALVDNDGSEMLSITISNLPAGASLSAGHQNADGSWTLAPADLAGLTLLPPTNWSGNVNISVTATSSENGSTASTSGTLPLSISGVATTPSVSATAAVGTEDHGIPLMINAALTDADGSETLTITLNGLPTGTLLSAGTLNADGSWTLSPADLAGLVLTPPAHWSGSANITVTATSSESGTTASASTNLSLTVNGEATTPSLSVTAAAGTEGAAVTLTIQVTLTDTDGSETLSIVIDHLPPGAILSAGTQMPDGSWHLTGSDLAGLTMTPAAGWSGNANLVVTAISTENGSSASINASLPINISGVATPPLLTVLGTNGTEDSVIPISISASLVDADGSETLSIVVSGVPAGATLSAGTLNADGSWSLTQGDLAGLALTPPPHFSGAINLTVAAISSESGTTATVTASLPIAITGVASTPTLLVGAASGTEDSAIALPITASLTDTDGSETLSLTITGVPAGASLSAGSRNADGSWSLAPGDLTGLTLTPPAHWSGTFSLTVAATSTEGGTSATVSAHLPITITGEATAPALSVAAAAGNEDAAIPLQITAALVDTDGSETLSILISGVPNGATLSSGTRNADGTWSVDPADLNGLTLTPPAHWSGAINLDVAAIATENGLSAVTHASLGVTVTGVATPPLVSAAAASGNEDNPIALAISATLADNDGSETLSVHITGVPAGASLSAGHLNADGSWSLTPADLAGLSVTPPAHWSGSFNLTITGISSEGSNTASTSTTLPVAVTGVATAPSLSVTAATGTEGQAIPLAINAALVDVDGSETLSLTITGLPVGAHLSAGTQNADGSWTLAPSDLSGLALVPPADWSGSAQLAVTATSNENGSTASVSANLPISVTGVATAPLISLSAAHGTEDSPVALTIGVASTDADGSDTLSVVILGVPAGATLSAGSRNADGSWSLAPADLPNLTLTPPAHWSGTLNLTIGAQSAEDGTTASSQATLPIVIDGVATPPALSVGSVSGQENQAIALPITAALVDTDGSETLTITISGLPTGATLSAGTQNPDGSWSLLPGDLAGLAMNPPPHWSGTVNLTVTAISVEGTTTASTQASLPLTVAGVAETPLLSVASATGTEDNAIPLTINAALVDTDGSETLGLTIAGLPAGATLSAGVQNADGSWSLAPADLAGLSLTPPLHWSGVFNLSITATSTEGTTSAATTQTLPVAVNGAATPPTLNVSSAVGSEDSPIALNINAGLVDTDGSETLSIVIGHVPVGAVLSAGTLNADGTWTLSPGDLSGLTLTAPANWSGSLGLSVTAISSENGTQASVTQTLAVTVSGVADTPFLSVNNANGTEDAPLALSITALPTDTDGSEVLAVTVTGLPTGASLSAGTQNPDGSWTLTPADLANLTLLPPLHWSGSATLTVNAVTSENGTFAAASSPLVISIAGAATAPSLAVQAAHGNEDSAIPLDITAALNDTDGSETLSLIVGGLPAGASLSAGTLNADGSWTLAPADLSGLTLTPPSHWSGSFNLAVSAISHENGTIATVNASLPVSIDGTATPPLLTVSPAAGAEDQLISLPVNAALADTDGSETLSITISGLPSGSVLSAGTANPDGSWTLAPADLAGLTITPPHNWSGSANLVITATSAEGTTTANTSTILPLTVSGVADAPALSVGAATGTEDVAVPLAITAALTDTDGSELLSVNISSLPAGASLSAGTLNADGSWTLTPAQLSGLMLLPPVHASGSFALTVAATANEDGTTATTTASLPVTIGGVATTPSLTVQAASGNEDSVIPLNISAALTDTDGSETLSVTITGVPGGATLSAGTLNADGSWSLAPTDLANLTLTPPLHWAGSLNLTVTATSAENGTIASASSTLPVAIAGVATAPHLAVVAASGIEDHNIPLSITASLSDTDGSETLSLVITGLPAGASLSAGTRYADGSWNLSPSDLAGLALVPPLHWSGSFSLTVAAISMENGDIATVVGHLPVSVSGEATTPTLSVNAATGTEDVAVPLTINAALVDTDGSETLGLTIAGLPQGATLSAGILNADGTWSLGPADLTNLSLLPPAHWSGSFNLTVTATSVETGTTASIGATLPVTITGVATAPTLSVMAASGAEDTNLPLSISAGLVDTDGSEALSILIDGLPAGAILSAGTHNADGSWSLAPADLAGLTLTPPAHWSGTFALTVSAISAENGTTAVTQANLAVIVAGVATAPSLSVGPATGNEDTAIALPLSAALVDTDGSETLSIIVSGLPNGAVLSAGTQNPDGSWSLTPAQLSGLTITPPLHWSGSVNLTVTATASESGTTATTSANLPLIVDGVATPPSLTVSAASGAEDTAIPVSINAALVDTDGSETLSVLVTGLPAGATLSAGTQNPDGSWTLSPAQLSGLTFTPPLHWSGNISLTVAAVSAENGSQAQTTATLPIAVAGFATTPQLSVQAANGTEDNAVPLGINAALADNDGSETLSVTITGVLTGATLSAGTLNADGSWSLQPGDLTNLTLTPPAHWAGSFTLGVTAISSENGSTASAQATLPVTIDGQATTPALSVTAASGVEDTALPLAINAALVDTDGSETLAIRVAGLPAGASLSAGTQNADGSWSLTPAQLSGLTLNPPAHWSGSFNLTVTATSSENGTTASTQTVLPASIGGVATTPTLAVSAASGSEDQPVALTIASALVDTDGSETLGLRIDGVPSGATLSAGTQNPDGSWSLTPAQLNGLTLTPPANWSGSFTLSVTATSSEGATTASTSTTLPVSISGIADSPVLNVAAASGSEDTPVALAISAALTDTDGSEALGINIAGLPSGATLSAGTLNPDGTWSLTPAQLNGLTLTPPVNWSGSFNLSVTAISSESGTTATSTTLLPVTIAGVADTPTLTLSSATGAEDSAIPLGIGAGLTDTDGSEALSITVTGLPSGAALSAGTHNPDGSWTLTPAQLTGLTFTPPHNWSGSAGLTVTATSSENGTTASTSGTLNVTVGGVADAPTLAVSSASGVEDNAIPLTISAALTDTDGSEALSIIVAGMPSGATLSAGTHNPDGSWTLSQAQLSGLTLTPPANWSGSFNLAVTATSSENGTNASTQATLPVSVAGMADAPTLSVSAASGAEDTGIPLSITAALTDTDGSEALAIVVAGMPSGATLSAGVQNPDGSWTLTPSELTGLTFTPPHNWSGSVGLTVTATSSENGTTASTSGTLNVTVGGVADTPALSVSAASGNEDTAIPLAITAALTDTDGSEALSILIAGVPSGAALSTGTHNPDGTWSLTQAQLAGLTLSPPHNWSGSFNLTVTATSFEGGTTASSSASLPVTIGGVADAPTLSLAPAIGTEDNNVALNISAALTDTDGSEALSITIAGVPAGASLSAGTHNPDGSWTLLPAQLVGLTLSPPTNWSGSFNLTVTATSAENGTTANTQGTLPVTIGGVADTPTLSVSPANGTEDNPVSLTIASALVDTDGSETLSIRITGLPTGASLSAGIHNPDDSWTLSGAQLAGLAFVPPANWSGVANLSVTATSSENGTTASQSATLPVTVTGIADTPNLNVATASGNEDTAISLSIAASLADTDGSETLGIRITGVPSGAALSAGTLNGDGSWSLSTAQLSGLKLTPPSNFSGTIALTVTATASENATTASTSSTLNVTVLGVADTPTLSVSAASGAEDTPIALSISAGLADTDGSETLGITITGIPSGAALSAGIHNPDGSWTLSPAQLSGLTLTPPHNWSGSLALGVTAVSSENGTTASSAATLNVTVGGVADAPTISASPASGNEDTAIPLTIAAALTDTDGSEALSIAITGVPSNATLSAGIHNPDGSWTLTPAQLTGLTLSPPANWSGSFNLTITATSSENGTTASQATTLPVTIAGVADAPTLSVSAASGVEDTPVALTIASALVDTDGSESLSIRISGLPTGASLSAGTQNPDGSWTLSSAQLGGLTLIPAANWSGSASLTVAATSSENGTTATTQATLPLTITGVADMPTLSVAAASGPEDTAISLSISSALTDTDGSETLSLRITGMPSGASLSAGTLNGDGSWSLTSAQLSGLKLTPPTNWSGTFNLTVAATSNESGTTATTQATLPVTVTGVADAPSLTVTPASGAEDTAISLSITAALTDTDGSETLSLRVTGVPSGASLSAGTLNGDGSWSLTPAQLSGLKLTPPSNFSGAINLTVAATSSENGTTATTSAGLTVTVTGVADTPTLSVSAASGGEDTNIALAISTALTDTDGSETLSIRISSLPSGATLSKGTQNADGSWTLTPAQLSGLTFRPPTNWSGVANLSVTATSSENGTTASQSATLPVTVAGIADTPNLSVVPASGNEDTAISLSVSASLADTDGSESLAIRVTGVPSGASLSAGTLNGDGSWSLTAAQLSGLKLTPPSNFSGSIALTVTATASENATTASTSATLNVTVLGVADAPNLTVLPSTGLEDTAIALSITPSLADTDGSETLSVLISGVPTGAILSAGLYAGNNSWAVSPSALAGLTITPPKDFAGTINLTVRATSTETSDGSTTHTDKPLVVTVTPVADAPTLGTGPSATVTAAIGNEDTAIPLNIRATSADADGSETLSVVISGMPTGAVLSAGTLNANGTWTLTASQLTGLAFTPPLNRGDDYTLTVTVTSTDSNGATASTSTPLSVIVNAIADPVSALSAANVTGAAGTQIPLTLAGSLTDTDGSETLSFVIHGMPDGFALSAGVNNGDNSWTITPAQLAGLKLISPEQFNGQLNLHLVGITRESEGNTRVTGPVDFYARIGNYASGYLVDLGIDAHVGGIGVGVHVGVLPDIDLFPATGGLIGTPGLHVKEDTPILIADAPAILGLNILSGLLYALSYVTFNNVPTGTTFSAGTNLGGGTWQFTAGQLNNLYMTPPPNGDQDFTMVTKAHLLYGLATVTLTSTPVYIMGVADTPTLSASVGTATEDANIALNITGALTDTDGSETLSYLVSGMPTGFALNQGTYNGNGTWSLSAAQVAGLSMVPTANFSGAASVTISAIATERDGDQTVKQQTVAFNVTPVADAPILVTSGAKGTEDQPIALNLSVALTDTDGSESISAVTISGLPSGSSLTGATNNGNGTWSVVPSQIGSVKFVPPSHWSGDTTITVTATSREGSSGPTASTTATIGIHVDAAATTPISSATDSTGDSDTPIGLHLSAALADTDGSEKLSIVVSGIPDGASLSAGLNNGNGSWTLTSAQLSGLSLTPPAGFSGDLHLNMTAYSVEQSNGSTASDQHAFTVSVNAPMMMMAMMSFMSFSADDLSASWTDLVDPTAPDHTVADASASAHATDASAGFSETSSTDPHHNNDYQHAFDSTQAA